MLCQFFLHRDRYPRGKGNDPLLCVDFVPVYAAESASSDSAGLGEVRVIGKAVVPIPATSGYLTGGSRLIVVYR
jgi:hypothetical protein